MPKKKRIDVSLVTPLRGSSYPPPFDEPCRNRTRRRIGDEAGLTQFGVNVLVLPPGAWSAQRHWHTDEDELIYVLSGEVVLVTDGGEEILRAGDAAGFNAGEPNGHHLQNRSAADAHLLEIGSRIEHDATHYPGIDLYFPPGGKSVNFTHINGEPYPDIRQEGADEPSE